MAFQQLLLFIYLFFPFSPNLVAYYILSIPFTHVAVDTPQQPRHSAAREEQDIREHCASTSRIISSFTRDRGSETSVSRALLYMAIQQPLLSPPPSLPLPRSDEPLHVSQSNSAFGRAGIRNPDPWCVRTAN